MKKRATDFFYDLRFLFGNSDLTDTSKVLDD